MLIFCSVSKMLLLITFKNVLEAGTSGIFAVHFSVRERLWSDHLYFFFTLTQCWSNIGPTFGERKNVSRPYILHFCIECDVFAKGNVGVRRC